jgi:hypothetical protein
VGLILRNESSSTSAGARLTFSYQGSTTGYIGNQFDGGDFNNQYMAAQSHIWFTTTTERMRLTATGLGIGTNSPAEKLHVVGKIAVSGTNPSIRQTVQNAFLDLCGGTTIGTDPAIQIAGSTTTSDANKIFYNSNTHLFRTTSGGTTYATIDTSGNLLVGQTSRGTVNSNSFNLDISSAQGYFNHISGVATGSPYISFGYNASVIGSITQSGTTAVLYNVTSDQRLKENIVDAPEFGSVIDSLKVRSFDWKTDNTHQRAGFIAQELVTVAPEAVHQPVNEEDMMAVDYSKLVPMLVKEIQSLRTRLTALENK